jgi:hypothetical protein
MGVILRSKATKNLIFTGSAEILRGVYPELAERLRMTIPRFRMETNCCFMRPFVKATYVLAQILAVSTLNRRMSNKEF